MQQLITSGTNLIFSNKKQNELTNSNLDIYNTFDNQFISSKLKNSDEYSIKELSKHSGEDFESEKSSQAPFSPNE